MSHLKSSIELIFAPTFSWEGKFVLPEILVLSIRSIRKSLEFTENIFSKHKFMKNILSEESKKLHSISYQVSKGDSATSTHLPRPSNKYLLPFLSSTARQSRSTASTSQGSPNASTRKTSACDFFPDYSHPGQWAWIFLFFPRSASASTAM